MRYLNIYGVFPIKAPHEIIAPHHSIFTIIGEGDGLSDHIKGGWAGLNHNFIKGMLSHEYYLLKLF